MYLAGSLIMTPNEGSQIDKLDIGVMKMREDMLLPPYQQISKFPIRPDRLLSNQRPSSESYGMVVGFPATKGKINPVGKSIAVTTYSYHTYFIDRSEYEALGLDIKHHFAMRLDLKEGYGTDGKHRNFPKPQGMSGSPIWIIFKDNNDQGDFFPVVAVATEYWQREKILVGTNVSIVYELAEKVA